MGRNTESRRVPALCLVAGGLLLGLAIGVLLLGVYRSVVQGERFGLHAVPLGAWMILVGILPWTPCGAARAARPGAPRDRT